ncbi:ISAzo13-like element transposase-related protein [Nodosilinea sp. LEGE 07298]|uniref:ISAzo13-like element transposase-related protein n=1 Tax=Nodosilinea sp. LEGE 07298 TaxID=2777970 RepID=UPI001D13852D
MPLRALCFKSGFLKADLILEVACDFMNYWWTHYSCYQYPETTSLLLLYDRSGSNSARCYTFKQSFQALASALGFEICIAHYLPYTSKYNPIKHRIFPYISQACRGVIFDSVEMIRTLMAPTSTQRA